MDTWRTAFRGIVSEEYLNQLTYEQLTEHIVTMFRGSNGILGYVAETQPGEIIGFAAGGPEQSGRSDYRGELYGLFVTENHQRCIVVHLGGHAAGVFELLQFVGQTVFFPILFDFQRGFPGGPAFASGHKDAQFSMVRFQAFFDGAADGSG